MLLSTAEPHPVLRSDSQEQSHFNQPFLLLTSSMDGFVHIFAPEDVEQETGLFTAVITLHPHLMGSQGFYGAFWDIRGNSRNLVAYGYRGAMFQWIGAMTETPSNFSLLHSTSTHLQPGRRLPASTTLR